MRGAGADPGRRKVHHLCLPQGQLSPGPRSAYRDCLGRLDLQYAKLLVSWGARGRGGGRGAQGRALWPADPALVYLQNSSKARLRALEGLHGFVAAATKELMWLSEKEEEEVGFDWGEHNSNMAAKKESYSVRSLSRAFRDCPAPVGSQDAGWCSTGGPWCGPDTIPETRCLCVRP